MKPDGLENPLDLVRQHWTAVVHFKRWILPGALAMTLVALAYIARMPDYYKATTTILVDPQKIPEKYVSSTVSADPSARLAIISQDVLSASHLQPVMDKFHLYEDKNISREQAIEMMRSSITIEVKGGGGLSAFTISYVDRDPNVVANVANQLAASFIEDNVETREQLTEGTTEFLTSQLQRAKQNLEEQERKLREFKMQHLGEMPDQQQSNLQVLAQLQANFQANSDSLNRLDVQRMMLLRSDHASTGGSAPTERGRLQSEKRQLEQKIFDLKRKYTADFPEVVEANQRLERINAQLKSLPPDPEVPATDKSEGEDVQLVVIDRERKRLEEAQKHILAQIRVYQSKVEAAPLRESQVTDLTRNYDVSKNNYQSLLDKTFSAQMAQDLEKKQKAERFSILDPARVPEHPYKPKRLPLMFGAFVMALFVCAGLAIAKDAVNMTVKSEAEVRKLPLPSTLMFVSIPVIDTVGVRRHRRLVLLAMAIVSVLACLLEAAFLWRVHPYL